MPARTVILRHTLPDSSWHWDWLLQRPGSSEGAAVLTFRTSERPDGGPGPIRAVRLPDHRAMYLEYEGEVPGGRGRVERVATGEISALRESAGVVEVECVFAAQGVRGWRGVATPERGDGAWVFEARRIGQIALASDGFAR